MAFWIGMAVFAAALYWLYTSKSGDVDAVARELALTRVQGKEETTGTTPEGFAFHQLLWMRGSLAGLPAEVSERRVRLDNFARAKRQKASHFTVLSLLANTTPSRPFRLQPVGILGDLEGLAQSPPPVVPTGDATFDSAYNFYAEDPAEALRVLTPDLRQAILAMRTTVAGNLPDSVPGKLASGLLLGSFEVAPGRVSYVIYGTPMKKMVPHLQQVAPLLARLASGR